MNFSDRDLHRLVRPEQVSTWVAYLNSGSCKETRSIELRKKLVEMNLGLIDKRKSGEEHYGEWVENLIGAVERFDPSKGYAFSTFAKGSMGRGQHNGSVIAIPNYLRDNIAKIKKILAKNPGISIEELAEKTNLSSREVAKALEAGQLTVQGFRIRQPSGDITELDPKDPSDNYAETFEGYDLQCIINNLKPSEKTFIEKIYKAMQNGDDLNEVVQRQRLSREKLSMLFRKIRNSHRRY